MKYRWTLRTRYPRAVALLLTILTVLLALFGVLGYGSYHASEQTLVRQGITYSGTTTVPVSYVRRIDRIIQRLHDEDYGIGYAPVRTYPEDIVFRAKAQSILSIAYQVVDFIKI